MGNDQDRQELLERIEILEAERRTLLDILDLAPFFVYAVDAEGNYRFANRTAAEEVGHTTESVLAVRWQDVAADGDQARAVLSLVPDKIANGKPVLTPDVSLRLHNGTEAIIDLYEAPFRDADGKDWLLGIGRDKSSEVELERARVERAKLDRDLSIARTIQRSLLPTAPPNRPGLDVAGWTRPADDTGGDFYDWFTTDNGHTYLVLGDVTGHGIGPALIAATVRAYARAVFDGTGRLDHKTARLNTLLADELPGSMFVTLAVAQIPPDPSGASFVAAGHGPTYFVQALRFGGGVVQQLDSHGPPLGILDGAVYEPPTPIPLLRGAQLVLASDGLHETADPTGRLLGVDALASGIDPQAAGAGSLIDGLRRLVEEHAQGASQADDMTALAVVALGGQG